MAKASIRAGLVTGLLLGSTASVMAAPTASEMLRFRPKQDGVVCSTPTAAEEAACKVEPVQIANKIHGWLLKDAKGQPVRRFFATNSTNLDVWSYYLNGVEVYRELDSNRNGKADQYRYLNTGGSRHGIDMNEDGKVDAWKTISPEEVSQEVLQAVVKRDYSKIQALMVTDQEMKGYDMPAAEIARIQDLQRKASAKFQETCSKVGNISDKVVRWVHFEAMPPQCIPADTTGMKADLVKYRQGSVTYVIEGVDKPYGLLTGEIIQVGTAWRLVDAPALDNGQGLIEIGGDSSAGIGAPPSKEVQPLLDKLKDVDDKAPDPSKPSTTPAEVAKYNVARADVLEQIAAKTPPADRETWLRQMADCLSAAVQNVPTDKTPHQRLGQLRERVVREYPGSGLAAHVSYCELTADYAVKLTVEKDIAKVQKDWVEKLTKFVQDYPKAEDTPDALMQLGMVNELINEEGQAKKWYELMVKDFASHPQTSKARGAIKRLELDGKELELAGATLTGSPFDLKTMKSKVVLVYYWASWNQQCAGDFVKLKSMLTAHSTKGLDVVGISLDDEAGQARDFAGRNGAPGVQLHDKGGMSSKHGEQYGIMVLPTMFLIKDGKVVSHNAQMTTVEDELKKMMP